MCPSHLLKVEAMKGRKPPKLFNAGHTVVHLGVHPKRSERIFLFSFLADALVFEEGIQVIRNRPLGAFRQARLIGNCRQARYRPDTGCDGLTHPLRDAFQSSDLRRRWRRECQFTFLSAHSSDHRCHLFLRVGRHIGGADLFLHSRRGFERPLPSHLVFQFVGPVQPLTIHKPAAHSLPCPMPHVCHCGGSLDSQSPREGIIPGSQGARQVRAKEGGEVDGDANSEIISGPAPDQIGSRHWFSPCHTDV